MAPVGFMVTGMAGPYVRHVLGDLGLWGGFPILQMGMSYPADVELVHEFSRMCDQMVVVEACTNLTTLDWLPLRTNTLGVGGFYFSDPDWTNFPGRFYRARSL